MRLIPLFLVAALTLSGCVINSGHSHDDEYYGDISLFWTFAGKTCAQVPEIARVHVELNGPHGREALEANGFYKCSPAGVDGIKLYGFEPGSYTFTIDALDAVNDVLYTITSTLYVNGDVEKHVDLASTVTAGRMHLYWRFMRANQEVPCAATGIADNTPVTKVRIYINNESFLDQACTGADATGAAIQGWIGDKTRDPGSYQVTMQGIVTRNGVEQVWYQAVGTANVVAGQTQNITFTLMPVGGGATFFPILKDANNNTLSCNGVGNIHFQLTDYLGAVGQAYSCPCTTCMTSGIEFDYMLSAQYLDPTNNAYWANWTISMTADNGQLNPVTLFQGQLVAPVYAGVPAYDASSAPAGQKFDVLLHPK